jgi:hypothetical protein
MVRDQAGRSGFSPNNRIDPIPSGALVGPKAVVRRAGDKLLALE